MKIALFLGLWAAIGVALSVRAARPAPPAWSEVALSALFWPFFLGGGPAAPAPEPGGAVGRLLAALPAGERGAGLALTEALRGLEGRAARLDAAVAALPPGGAEEARALIVAAQQRAHAARAAAEDALEVAAARLIVLQAEGEGARAEPVLSGLLAQLRAIEEVEGLGAAGGRG